MLKKLLVLPLVALILVSVQRPVKAIIGTIDAVPAATLLVPYFEVDLNSNNGKTTLFSINNASATAVLAHVTLWSDLGVATFAYNVYLTGYDVETINVRDILNGTLSNTASAGQDPGDAVSPKGSFSQDINFASCTGFLPPPSFPPGSDYVNHMHAVHTGHASTVFFSGKCAGANTYGDNIARGYITVDTVNSCNVDKPGDPGYFAAGGSGIATDQNVLWGDYFYLDPTNNFASGDTLVHIEASGTNPETSTPGQYTFYGALDSFTAVDNREPLSTVFATRFLSGGPFAGGTDLNYWRDPKVNQAPFNCPTSSVKIPLQFPLNQEEIVVFDEQEHPLIPPVPPYFPQPPDPTLVPFPYAAGKVHVGGSTLQEPYSFGWLFLNMNTTVSQAGSNPPEGPSLSQAWISPNHSSAGRYAVGYSAIQLSNPANVDKPNYDLN